VRPQAYPEPRDADEVHDALLGFGVLPESDAAPWRALVDELVSTRRAVRMRIADCEAGAFFVASERAPLVHTAYGEVRFEPAPPALPGAATEAAGDPDAAVAEIVRGWMDVLGPTTAAALASGSACANRASTSRWAASKPKVACCADASSRTVPASEWNGANAACLHASTA
jgi:ATP-dependent Lhr-like helicase